MLSLTDTGVCIISEVRITLRHCRPSLTSMPRYLGLARELLLLNIDCCSIVRRSMAWPLDYLSMRIVSNLFSFKTCIALYRHHTFSCTIFCSDLEGLVPVFDIGILRRRNHLHRLNLVIYCIEAWLDETVFGRVEHILRCCTVWINTLWLEWLLE